MSDSRAFVARWPALPPTLRDLLGNIEAETEDGLRHPRPWDLASLPDELRTPVWGWLAEAVAWINECYTWRPETVIPPCWREHPHLALELAVLAFGRETAHRSSGTQEPAQWHQDLHDFHRRMAETLGAIGLQECQRGIHGERPARYELERYAS